MLLPNQIVGCFVCQYPWKETVSTIDFFHKDSDHKKKEII